MTLFRVSPIFRSSTSHLSPRTNLPHTFSQPRRLYAQQSYGGGDGDPKAGDPQNQGSNPSANLEHPGPPPPAEGLGTGGGPTKANDDGHNTKENKSSGSEENKEDTSASTTSSGAQPKIHSEGVPAEQSEEVRKHNEEYEKRHDRADTKSDDDGR